MGGRFGSRSEQSANVGAEETRGNHDDQEGEDDPVADLGVKNERLSGADKIVRRWDGGRGHGGDYL